MDIAPGGLSVIGESAFENAGCVQDSDGNWAVNTEGGVDELTMILPLADLTDIQPYAFKTKAIEKFTAVDSEATRNPNDVDAGDVLIYRRYVHVCKYRQRYKSCNN